jgi:hypothetical protein
MTSSTPERPSPNDPRTDWLEVVRQNVTNLRFGSVQITIHDGKVTQVESIEKTRFVATRDDAESSKRSI